MSVSAILLWGLALYAVAGIGTAAAFVTVGLAGVLPQPMLFTPGARLVLFPGAALLWPVVLSQWLNARKNR